MTDYVRTTKGDVGRGRPDPSASWLERMGRTFRRRHTITIDGVRYRERSRHSKPAGASREPGERAYEVRFGDGQTMRIRSTTRRVFDDLIGGQLATLYERAAGELRPGSRVLDLACGTGAGAATLAGLVGPSGSVVALDHDTESIRFARRRYREPNIAFEIGGVETLDGEPDGSFDAVFVVLGSDELLAAAPLAVRRVLRRGGRIVVVLPDGERDRVGAFGKEARCESSTFRGQVVVFARF